MGLIFFTYFFAFLLLVNSLYLSFYQSNYVNVLLNKVSIPATMVAFCLALSVHLAFYEQFGIQHITSIATLLSMILASYHIADMAFVISEVGIYPILKKVNAVIHLAGIVIVLFFVGRFQWNPLQGFFFTPKEILPGISGLRVFSSIYSLIVPCVAIVILFLRIFFVKSNIHRQQLLLHGFSIGVCLLIWIAETYYFMIFSWAFAFLPLVMWQCCYLIISSFR